SVRSTCFATSMFQAFSDPEAESVERDIDVPLTADGNSDQVGFVAPRTAPDDAEVRSAFFKPWCSVNGCPAVIRVPDVFYPFPHVAMHIVESECVRFKGADRSRLLQIPPAAAAVTICIAYADIRPQEWRVAVPARAAYSHSASVKSRYSLLVERES